VFNLEVPSECPGVPPEVLDPRGTWPSADEYDAQAAKLARMFADNFRTFENDVTPDVRAAAPRAQ
jgi:phosphoenolpyruvate carboxykinase (ATP)